MIVWGLLSITAIIVLLLFSRKGPNAIWGTATVAMVIGVGVAVYQPGFDWWTVGKAVVIGTFIGLVFELLPMVSKLWTKQGWAEGLPGMTAREIVEIILSASFVITPVTYLIHRTIAKTKEGAQFGIGVRSVQFLGVATLLPAMCILALEKLIDGCTVAALVGALVGYLFAGLTEFDKSRYSSWYTDPARSLVDRLAFTFNH
jgi:hypothetical protein